MRDTRSFRQRFNWLVGWLVGLEMVESRGVMRLYVAAFPAELTTNRDFIFRGKLQSSHAVRTRA